MSLLHLNSCVPSLNPFSRVLCHLLQLRPGTCRQAAMTTSTLTAAAPQRRAVSMATNSSGDWRCFPSPYVMRPERQTSRDSRNFNSASVQCASGTEAFQRPTTAAANDRERVTGAATLPRRARTRLQKRPSEQLLKKSMSTSAMPQPAAVDTSNGQNITALPQLPDQAIPGRSSSIRKHRKTASVDKLRDTNGVSDRQKTPHKPTQLSLRPKTAPSQEVQDAEPQQAPTTSLRTPRYQPLAPNDPSTPMSPFQKASNQAEQTTPTSMKHYFQP
jgi:hypothetical protein